MARLILVGFMGAGKSLGGREAARRLDLPFIDLDEELETRTGRSPALWFSEQGEEAFREAESTVLASLSLPGDCLLACGGGTLLREKNRRILSRLGTPLLLHARPDVLARRLSQDSRPRPLLAAADNLRIRIHQLLDARQAVYACCRERLDTSDLDPDALARAISRRWQRLKAAELRSVPPETLPDNFSD